MQKKRLIISAVNLVDGGTFEILRQCLLEASKLRDWEVTALVNNSNKIGIKDINYIQIPKIKASWFRRILFEYFESKEIAHRLKPDFWLSLHDISTNLRGLPEKIPQAVYCHNPMIFYKLSWREIWLEPKLFIFHWAYKIFYKINIHANSAVIVQQDWIRNEFIKRFKCKNVIVAHPGLGQSNNLARTKFCKNKFFYPSFPRAFKNFETLLRAWDILCRDPSWNSELILTIDCNVNRYGKWLYRNFKHLRNVNFIGKIPPIEMASLYEQCDCLVFSSNLETWGLPISEAKEHGLFIIASDLPYAHESVGNYDGVSYFKKNDHIALAKLMLKFSGGELLSEKPITESVAAPYAQNWKQLLDYLLIEKCN